MIQPKLVYIKIVIFSAFKLHLNICKPINIPNLSSDCNLISYKISDHHLQIRNEYKINHFRASCRHIHRARPLTVGRVCCGFSNWTPSAHARRSSARAYLGLELALVLTWRLHVHDSAPHLHAHEHTHTDASPHLCSTAPAACVHGQVLQTMLRSSRTELTWVI